MSGFLDLFFLRLPLFPRLSGDKTPQESKGAGFMDGARFPLMQGAQEFCFMLNVVMFERYWLKDDLGPVDKLLNNAVTLTVSPAPLLQNAFLVFSPSKHDMLKFYIKDDRSNLF